MTRPIPTQAIGLAGVLALVAGISLAQQGPAPLDEGGTTLSFGVTSGLRYSDNFSLRTGSGDSATLFDHDLSFALRSRTRTQSLDFGLSTTLRALDRPGSSGRRFEDPTARLRYERTARNSTLRFASSYRLTSVEFFNPFAVDDISGEEVPIDDADLTIDRGDRETINARLTLETGLNDPVGFVFGASLLDRRFSDTTAANLFDTRRYSLDGTMRLRFSPVTEGRLTASVEKFEAENAENTDRETSTLRFSLNHVLASGTSLNGTLGYQRIRSEQTILGLRESTSRESFIGSLGVSHELPTGTIGGRIEVSESVNGRRTSVSLSRGFEFPRGRLALRAGVTNDVNDDLRAIGSLNYTHELPRGLISASASKEVTTSSQDSEVDLTQIGLSYRFEINEASSIGLSGNFAETRRAGGGVVNEGTRTDIRVSYNHALTNVWQLSTGYNHRRREDSGSATATSNTIFLNIGRNFTVRP